MSMFKRNQRVVKLLIGAGVETASIQTVESVRKGQVKLEDSDSLRYDAHTGHEIDPAIPGFTSRLIDLEE